MAKTGLGRGLGALMVNTTGEQPAEKENLSNESKSQASGESVKTTAKSRVTADKKNAVSKDNLAGSDPQPSVNALPDGSYYAELPVAQIVPNPKQPRSVFDEDDLKELAESIKEVGLLQPISVRQVADGKYELIMGERRLRAHQVAGIETIGAIVRGTEDSAMLRDALLENLHRVQLNPLEEAAAYQQLMEEFDCTQEELSSRIKRSRPQISNTIRLLKLPLPVQRRVAAGVLSAGHARALLMVKDGLAQEKLAQRIVAEGLSVRATEEIVTLADWDNAKAPRTRSAQQPNPKAVALSSELGEHFDTRVKVNVTKSGRGKITIDFASEEDLERILAVINHRTI